MSAKAEAAAARAESLYGRCVTAARQDGREHTGVVLDYRGGAVCVGPSDDSTPFWVAASRAQVVPGSPSYAPA